MSAAKGVNNFEIVNPHVNVCHMQTNVTSWITRAFQTTHPKESSK